MSNRSKIAQNKLNRQNIKITAFNCKKNVKTSTPAINELFEAYDIILLQEHWLFEFHLHLLGVIGADISYIGKALDVNNNIQPTQLPRGYGGVAILWKKQDNNLIKQIPDGNERIQCIEFIDNFNKPLLIISAYLPTRGNYEVDVFMDGIDQLYEIFQKFKDTHDILIGGDLNEESSLRL
jgi:exonuclease III